MKYNYELSTKKNKKLMVIVNNKTIHFGDIRYQHFNDSTNLLDKKLNHRDKKRQASYLARARGIKNKQGQLTYKDPTSPNYHAVKILWS